MKRLMILSLALMAICGSVCATSMNIDINSKTWRTVTQNIEVINICDLTDFDLIEIMQGNHPELAVEFLAKTSLPLSLFLRGDLINLVENDEGFKVVEIEQTFYVRCVEQEFIFSTNLIDWKPFFEFLTGNASVSLSIQDGKPSILVGVEANKRS